MQAFVRGLSSCPPETWRNEYGLLTQSDAHPVEGEAGADISHLGGLSTKWGLKAGSENVSRVLQCDSSQL